jgi:uncharacterized protein YbjT (DUF2867 family)
MAKLVVFGGSGVIGRGVLEAASADDRIDEVRALQRRPVEPALSHVVETKVDDFANLSSHRRAFEGVDACIFALGIAQALVTEEEYHRITVDDALEAARRLPEGSPNATFVFVSGQGADSTERSRILFARVKGKTENLLKNEPVGRLVVTRPGGVIPTVWPRQPRWTERLLRPVMSAIEPMATGIAIKSLDLGRALVQVALDSTVTGLLENRDLRRIAAARA